MRTIKRLALTCIIAIVGVALVSFIGALVSPSIAWRVRLYGEKLTGRIPEIPLPLLVRWSAPRSPVNLYHLSETPNVNAAIENQLTDRASGLEGAKTFGHICSSCHGDERAAASAPTWWRRSQD